MTTNAIYGFGILLTVALGIWWRLTGISPLLQISRNLDNVRACWVLVGRVLDSIKWTVEKDWEYCQSKVRRER
jgi:hypothetical protein